MNKLLPLLFLLATLGGCSDKNSEPAPAPVDPLLGQWQADNLRGTVYDAAGKVVSDSDGKQVTKLEVTPTTMVLTHEAQGVPTTTSTHAYTRNGELLTFPNATDKVTVYARDLTSSSFKMEFNEKKVPGQTYYIQSFSFHR
jgi:hypothetical protein